VNFQLDRHSDVPLYLQIRNQLRDAIVRGDLAEGERLPPERQLAGRLDVNRTTVVNAYRELAADGLVEGFVGRGTIVCWSDAQPSQSSGVRPLAWSQQFSSTTQWPGQALVQEAADLSAEPGVISLASGVPAPELYPLDEFRVACDDFLSGSVRDLLANCPVEGFQPLRQWLADWLNGLGANVSTENVLVTAGSTQGLALVSAALIDPNDEVAVEAPSSLAALQSFSLARARLLGIPLDADGLRTDVLGEMLERHRPKFLYTLPTFQNPTGATLSLARRQLVLRQAEKQGLPIVEDDPYSALYFDAPPPPPLKAFDQYGYVIYIGTFSKLLFPSLRLGWIAAPRPVIERLAIAKRNTDLFANTLAQGATWHLLSRLDWNAYLLRLRAAYRQRRDAMLEALRRHAPLGLSWQTPAGGFYIWVHLPEGVSAQSVLAQAHQTGVAFLPGEPFCVDGSGRGSVRLNFSYAPMEDIETGVQRFAQAVSDVIRRRREAAGTGIVATRTVV
jgi:2-aminoadipate transaminase